MAIAFARARYIGRSTGGVAVRSAAYNAREAITDERTGELYSFKHRDAPEHHEVLLPEGADAALADSATLWNAAEAAEKRKDAQVARELVIALPADREISDGDRLELVRSFAQEHFVSRGLAVQLDIHAPHVGEGETERANWHAHLLVTTRRVEGDHLSAKKARDLDPEVRRFGSRNAVTEGEAWGELWRDHQNRYFVEQGLSLRVDATSAVPQEHVGPVRMRAADCEAVARDQEIARQNAIAARDPDRVLEVLTRNCATFTERELDRHLAKHIRREEEHLAVRAKVLGHGDVRALHDPETGELVGRYTTTGVREQERAALADAEAVAGRREHNRLGSRPRAGAIVARDLREDQRAAFDHATDAGGLKVIEGRAGTGKSYTLSAVREAHERAGYTVIGLAPTNSVAQDLKADGFGVSATIHSELFRLKNGRTAWSSRTLVVVDEAAMLDSRITGELLTEARRSGAKLVLAGDDRQLASIERGGLFSEIRQRHGSAEITVVTRQKVDWQRQAARDLADGRTGEAVAAFEREGAISWSASQEDARGRLVERWKADTAADPAASRFVFAYTNVDVDALNASLREVRRERGELGADVAFQTKHGEAAFAVGDRVQFTDTLRSAKIYNGNAGVITAIDGRTGTLTAELDGAAGQGREVSWRAEEFVGFRHGYAGTIYKGQGKTLDHTYLYHSHHWRQSSSYVALTRQRESAQIFVARETARDTQQLARQMSRTEVRAASVAWATADELPPALRPTLELTEPLAPKSDAPDATATTADTAKPPAAEATTWWIAPRCSVGPIEPSEVAAAVARNAHVQREREALGHYLVGAYRDPHAARAQLNELVKSHGSTSAAQRLASDPTQLGELRGATGMLVGSAARQERAQAIRVSEAVGPSVARIGEAQATAAGRYREEEQARRASEATGVPELSEAARVALQRVGDASDGEGRAQAWKVLQDDPKVAGEVNGFMSAVEGRFGADSVRSAMRTGQLSGAKVEMGQASALSEIGKHVQMASGGRLAAESQAMRISLAQSLTLGARLRP